jgi:hypothetical protein
MIGDQFQTLEKNTMDMNFLQCPDGEVDGLLSLQQTVVPNTDCKTAQK